jgi:hypothetical protein
MTTATRSQRVDSSRIQARLSVQQLWLHYISLSGVADLLEVDAYLHGVFTLGSYQEDKLSYAVNEELAELHEAARLPYSYSPEPAPSAPVADPLDVLRELLETARADRPDSTGDDDLERRSPG